MSALKISELMKRAGIAFGTSGARGLVESFTDQLCHALTLAFLENVALPVTRSEAVVIGHDLRPSSPRITRACISAIESLGLKAIYGGQLPTPALAFYAMKQRMPAIVITGSHIPFDRNGIKFYRADGEISKADEQAITDAGVHLPDKVKPAALPQQDNSVKQAYIQRYLDCFDKGFLSGKQIAVYEHSSAARDLLTTLLESLGARVISLGRTDTFVPIDTEAVSAEDRQLARQWAADYQFDAILSTDGDADRPLIGDETGHWLRGDIVGILCSEYLKTNIVATPVSCNTALEKSGLFRQTIRTRIGSPYVIKAMQQAIQHQAANNSSVIAGYEANGGFLLGSDVKLNGHILAALPTRDAVLPLLALLAFAGDKALPLSQLAGHLPPRFTASDRIKIPTDKSRGLIEVLAKNQAKAADLMAPGAGDIDSRDLTDGLRLTFSNGDIIHLRPSGNAPELRCYAESDTPADAEKRVKACLEKIQSDCL